MLNNKPFLHDDLGLTGQLLRALKDARYDEPTPIQQRAIPLLLDGATGFVSFGEDDAGELYLVALDGSLYRIEAEATG